MLPKATVTQLPLRLRSPHLKMLETGCRCEVSRGHIEERIRI
jgi:hypothetical protein